MQNDRWGANVQTLEAFNGVVVAGHPLAATAGIHAMLQGGNSIDAAVTAAAVSAVVMPDMCGLGGDLIALVKQPGKTPTSVIACGALPAAFRRDNDVPINGPLAALPPAAPRGWSLLVERYGSLPWNRILEPAFNYANEGFPVSFLLAQRSCANFSRLAHYPSSGHFTNLRPGDRLRQERLAATIKKVAEKGVEDLYSGTIGEMFIAGTRNHGGVITQSDLNQTMASEEPAINSSFYDFNVWTAPPPSHGITLLQALSLVEETERRLGQRPIAIADAVRIVKLVLTLREKELGDPLVFPFDGERLLSNDWVKTNNNICLEVLPKLHGDTTFIGALDRKGNACSLLQSVYTTYGSAFVEPNTGILLNNRVAGFSKRIGSPNSPSPGKRPIHNMTPCLATKGDNVLLVFGTPGGYAQIQTNLQFMDRYVTGSTSLYDLVHGPRWVFGTMSTVEEDDVVSLEPELFECFGDKLLSQGFKVVKIHEPFEQQEIDGTKIRTVGSLKVIEWDMLTGTLFAVADHRRHGCVAAF